MELREYVRILRDQWLLVVSTLLVVVAGAALVTVLQTPRYTATTELFFSIVGGESVSDVAQGSFASSNQMESYALVAKSPLVLGRVTADLQYPGGVGRLEASTEAQTHPQTVVLAISVTDADPVLAARLANAIGDATIEAVGTLNTDGQSDIRVKATTLARAVAPMRPSEPDALRNLAAAAAAGLVLGWALAFARNLLDNKIRGTDDIKRLDPQLPALGAVPVIPSPGLVLLDAPHSPAAEAYRRLSTTLPFITSDTDRRSLLVTSSVPGEGKSTTAANLAVALAETGVEVLLIDADLRRPTISSLFGLEGAVGLTTVLSDRASVDDVLQPSGVNGLTVLTAGQAPPNPSSLLGSRRMQALLEWAEQRYALVLMDSPPLLPVTDATVLAPQCGTVVLIVSEGTVSKPELAEALEALVRVDSRASGYMLNRSEQMTRTRLYEYHPPETAVRP